jgi:hypothetical protein
MEKNEVSKELGIYNIFQNNENYEPNKTMFKQAKIW